MNTKKIAKNIRAFAEQYNSNRPDIQSSYYTWLNEIADELDPPDPAPLNFNVGDWVEYKGKHYRIQSINENCGIFDGKPLIMFENTIWGTSDIAAIRKLDPSEVIVRIGCLSGTVTYAISDDCFLLAKVNDPQHRACCIDMSMLDIPTRELVEALLKAQEEK